MRRVKVSQREVCQKALLSSVSSLYFMTVGGWQSFSFDSTAIRSKISLGGKWEMGIPVSKFCVSPIAAQEWLSVLQSASCDEVSLLIW